MCRTEMLEMRHWECAYCGPVSVHVRATVSSQLLTGPNCCKVTDWGRRGHRAKEGITVGKVWGGRCQWLGRKPSFASGSKIPHNQDQPLFYLVGKVTKSLLEVSLIQSQAEKRQCSFILIHLKQLFNNLDFPLLSIFGPISCPKNNSK